MRDSQEEHALLVLPYLRHDGMLLEEGPTIGIQNTAGHVAEAALRSRRVPLQR